MLTPDDFLPPATGGPDGEPPMNIAMEDLMAMCVTSQDASMVLDAWLRLGVERLARECGRAHAVEKLRELTAFAREARPTPDWPA